MSQLRIFSYLPNPRIWKATIAARLCGVDVEVRGAAPVELQSWLRDFDARPLSPAGPDMAKFFGPAATAEPIPKDQVDPFGL